MKQLLHAALFSSLLIFAPPGCETINKAWMVSNYTTSEATANALILHAEQAAKIGKDVFTTFLKLEQDNRNEYWSISHEIKHKADWLRALVPDPTQIIPGEPPTRLIPRNVAYLKSLRKATMTFKTNRTAEGEASLKTALATINSVIDDVKRVQGLALAGGNP